MTLPPREAHAKRSPVRWVQEHRTAIVVAVVAFAAALVVAAQLRDDPDPASPDVAATSFGGDWVAPDGSAYRIRVVPGSSVSTEAGPDGCVDAPAPGRTNLAFVGTIENLGDEPAPIPEVAFGVNAGSDGQVDPTIASLDRASTDLEVDRRADDACQEANVLSGTDTLEPGEVLQFSGVVGSIREPVGQGLALILEYTAAGAEGEPAVRTQLLAPYPVYNAVTPEPSAASEP